MNKKKNRDKEIELKWNKRWKIKELKIDNTKRKESILARYKKLIENDSIDPHLVIMTFLEVIQRNLKAAKAG